MEKRAVSSGAARVRLIDIASEAGVSIATVDRVINDRGGVGLESAARVKEAIERLNYVPSFAAQSLSRRTIFRFAFLLPAAWDSYVGLLKSAIERARREFADFGVHVRVATIEAVTPRSLAERFIASLGAPRLPQSARTRVTALSMIVGGTYSRRNHLLWFFDN
jgi:LacI family transcriptional regulator